ncbi:VOC family protein [Nonomuraea sp. NPDC049152]|uniref:VOC family protein n=1 Tax=Nonomuraea sp. NPDC049152 TaxID=3154350 RepID=UPI0033E3BC6F
MQKISTYLWFDNQAEEAANHYVSIFDDSRIVEVTPMIVTFELEGHRFLALNGGPQFRFNEAISLYVDCESQDEVDELWAKLTADGGEDGSCGWLKDKYGLSWQIIPKALPKLLSDPDPARAERAMQAMLKMSKIDVKALEDAANG